MNGAMFPLWQVDRGEYELACAHLGLTPRDRIYEMLSEYLARAPFTFAPPRGLARALAQRRLTAFRLARLDLASRWFFPAHPIRHILNAVLALHECDGAGYREMARAPIGRTAWLALAGWTLRAAANHAITLSWLAAQCLAWTAWKPFAGGAAAAGRRVLITGVNRGLGMDLMLECLERGARVIGTVRTEASRSELLARLPASAPVTLLVADLSQPGMITDALDAAGVLPASLDMVVLSAGTKHDGQSVLSLERVRDTFQVNCFSAMEVAAWLCAAGVGQGASPSEPAAGPGERDPRTALVLVSSMGRWHGMHSTAGYNASKAALSIWAESLEMELHLTGKRRPSVTIVEPGLFESGMVGRRAGLGLLFASRRRVAGRILDGAVAGRKVLRPPFWFALVTWAVCLGGRGLRQRLFARAKPKAPR
ncbi:MAG: hypothetical protein AUK49_14440 [Betaproteobacteria bacterium CG2_30_68_42]|nr:MAG: hypothetical protein AUK49_14440 [Betaproteobacteria bacterium CG2_30_68_42]